MNTLNGLKKSRYTKRFAFEVYRLTSITTNQEAGWFLGMDDEAVYRIDKNILKQLAIKYLKPTPISSNISVDEVAYKKHHNYVTNVIDTDLRKVVWNCDGRTKETIDKHYKEIGYIASSNIQTAAMDGANAYMNSTKEHALFALIIYDKFHIIQKLNNAIDIVRRTELRKPSNSSDRFIYDHLHSRKRFILVRSPKNITSKQNDLLQKLCSKNKSIFKAIMLKEYFYEIYNCNDYHEAKIHLFSWIISAKMSGLDAFIDLAKSFQRKRKYILNWFLSRRTSAISEGINNKIKRLKRMAYGYRDTEYFKLKIHQHCGLLSPRYIS